MSVLALMLQQETGGGPVEKIARTFGVDWPHLTAQFISFAIVCAALYWLAYQPVLRMLEARRQQIALGLANTEKINAALANIESQRQSVMAEAQAQSADSSPKRARSPSASRNRRPSDRSPRPSRSWPRRARRPSRSTRACSPSCGARSVAWSSRPRRRSSARF